jgi:predicted nucleotidyltransferase
MIELVARILEPDERIAYALVFGSTARGRAHATSDVDVAVEFRPDSAPDRHGLEDLAARLERAAGRAVDLVRLERAPPALAYRVFRDGIPIAMHDREAFVTRKARAILEYLDFQPVEEQCTRGVLAAASRDRRSAARAEDRRGS